MNKKNIFLGVILISMLFGGLLLNKKYDKSIPAVNANETLSSDQIVDKKSEGFTKKLFLTLQSKNFRVSSTGIKSEPNEISVTVDGTEQYLSEVRNEITIITSELSKSTIYESYPIIVDVKREIVLSDGPNLMEFNKVLMNVLKGLSDYDVVGDISSEYQKSITIKTSISSSNTKAKKLAKEIEEKVAEIIKTDGVSNFDSYEIYVNNKDGSIIK